MTDKSEDYLEGWECAHQYYTFPCFAGFTRNIDAANAIKLFKPPVNESMVMVSTPIPKDRQEWMNGFNDWRKENLT